MTSVRIGAPLAVATTPQQLYLFKADGSACPRLQPGNMTLARHQPAGGGLH